METTPPAETPPTESAAPPQQAPAAKTGPFTPNRIMFAIGGLIIVMMVFSASLNVADRFKVAKKCQAGDIAVCTALIEAKSTTDKQRGGYYALRGFHYGQKGEHGKAIDDFSSAIATNTASPEVYAYRATSYVKLARYEEAIADFNTAIRLTPKPVPDFYCALIDAEYRKGDAAAGEADLQKLKTMAPQAACIAQLSPPAPAGSP
jgi:tetratricopeptide (TPR) repeat protein